MVMKQKHLHYGWVMVIITVCVLAAHTLISYTIGVFLKPLTAEFGWERGAFSGAISMYMLLAGGLSIFAGRLSDKYGPRILITLSGLLTGIGFMLMSRVNSLWQAYLVWGLLMGIGSACCAIPALSTIPRWFVQKTGMAVGITVAGIGLGAIIAPPLAQWLISLYGWQQAFVVLGIITLVITIPLAQLMKHSPQRIGLKPYGEDKVIEDKQSPAPVASSASFTQAIKTGRFWVFGLINLSFFLCVQAIIVHIVPYAGDIGIPEVAAASILSVIGGISILGRLFTGVVSDRVGGRLVLAACPILMTLSLIWLLFAREIWGFYLFAVVFGFAYGGMVSLLTIVAAELFGHQFLGIILGSFLLFTTVGGALGVPLAGFIFDMTGNYSSALLICAIVGALAVVLGLVLLRYKEDSSV